MIEPEEKYTDDRDRPFWDETTPATMQAFTERLIFKCITDNGSNHFSDMARSELSRRRNNELKRTVQFLTAATENVQLATKNVQSAVVVLTHSSERLEVFTKRLIKLTWFLIVVAIITAIIPIGIEAWKFRREVHEAPSPQTVPVSEPPKPAP